MRIAVCVKQVPDTEARLRVAGSGQWVDEEDLPFVINESDEYALEEALQIAEATSGEVVVFTMGPDRAREAIRKALALGAGRAVWLKDEAFSNGDALTNGRALAAAIRREEFDLVLTGSQSNDIGYGSTGAVIAAELERPQAWLVMGLEIEEGGATAKVIREMESGKNEILRIRLPAVIEVQAGINHPRYASLKGIMQAKKKPVEELTAADLGLSPEECGASGSRVEIVAVDFPDSGAGAQMLDGDPESVAADLVDKLRTEARVL